MTEILVPISLFAAIFGIMYVIVTARNKERLALIEKGVSAELFDRKGDRSRIALKLGLLFLGVGLGVLIGAILESAGMNADAVYPAAIFFFAGLGLLISHYIEKSEIKKENEG